MSEAAAEKFIEKLEKDKALVAELKKDEGNVEAVGKKNGFDFTAADLRAAVKKKYGGKKSPAFDDPNLTCFPM